MTSRVCVDCGHRWTPSVVGPWLDPMVCEACGSDETVGVTGSLEDELAAITGDRWDRALGEGRH